MPSNLNDEVIPLDAEARALKRKLFGVKQEWHLQKYEKGGHTRYDLQSATFTDDLALTISGNFLTGDDPRRDKVIEQLLTILNDYESQFSI